MKRIKFTAMAILAIGISVASCKKDNADVTADQKVTKKYAVDPPIDVDMDPDLDPDAGGGGGGSGTIMAITEDAGQGVLYWSNTIVVSFHYTKSPSGLYVVNSYAVSKHPYPTGLPFTLKNMTKYSGADDNQIILRFSGTKSMGNGMGGTYNENFNHTITINPHTGAWGSSF